MKKLNYFISLLVVLSLIYFISCDINSPNERKLSDPISLKDEEAGGTMVYRCGYNSLYSYSHVCLYMYNNEVRPPELLSNINYVIVNITGTDCTGSSFSCGYYLNYTYGTLYPQFMGTYLTRDDNHNPPWAKYKTEVCAVTMDGTCYKGESAEFHLPRSFSDDPRVWVYPVPPEQVCQDLIIE